MALWYTVNYKINNYNCVLYNYVIDYADKNNIPAVNYIALLGFYIFSVV